MEDKKVLASNNSKSKEMLEAIAINKQTENLRKNKLSMLDRAKEARSKAEASVKCADPCCEKCETCYPSEPF